MPATSGVGHGKYRRTGPPRNAFDQDGTSRYAAFGSCSRHQTLTTCGTETGLYLTPSRGASTLVAIQFQTTSASSERDPLMITIEGSNQPPTVLTSGSSWVTIYTGPTGLTPNPGRSSHGTVQYLTSNAGPYTSYRLLVTSIRGNSRLVSYAEVRLLGYWHFFHNFYSFALPWTTNIHISIFVKTVFSYLLCILFFG